MARTLRPFRTVQTNMNIEFKTGNYKLTINGTVGADKTQKVLEAGMTYFTQRDVASNFYLMLCGVENAKGKTVLPKDFERKSLKYSATDGLKIQAQAETKLAEWGVFSVTVEENVQEDDTTKEAIAMATKAIKEGKAVRNAVQIAEFCGYEVEDATDVESLAKGFTAYYRKVAKDAKVKANAGLE